MTRLRSRHDRAIALLAVPALGSLVADPVLSLVDTAFVGRIGPDALAALGIAAAIFGVSFFAFNFLEYGTTSQVARAVGGGDIAAAGRAVATALAIALAAGAIVGTVLIAAAGPLVRAFGADGPVADAGTSYVAIRALAAPAVLVVRAGHGAFRGFQDTRTPMVVALATNGVNLILDPILIFVAGWGIAGAAWATVTAQWIAAVWFGVLLSRRAEGFGLRGARPAAGEVGRFLRVGRDLAIRTAALLATFTVATVVAARISSVSVAAHQVLSQLFLFSALALDALAIAAQALIGRHLGAGDTGLAREVADRLLALGAAAGVGLGAVLAVVAAPLPGWFSGDAEVRALIAGSYWLLVVMQPVAGVVFVWDGVFIGAGDFAFLARAMVLSAALACAALIAVPALGSGLPGVWLALIGFLIARCVTLAWRRFGRAGPLRVDAG